jgi:glycerol-3-phosphate dehydrogenase (NAD(P)+)
MEKKIVIVGNGQIGEAISFLLKSNPANSAHLLEIFDKEESKNESQKNLKDCVSEADFLFLCVPSWIEEEILSEISSYLPKKTKLIAVAKGISIKTKRTSDKMLEKICQKQKYALLSGPMFAKEIVEGKMSYGILATKKTKTFEEIRKLFENTKLKLEHEKRVSSIAMVAVLKNIYALLLVIIESSGEKNNTKGYLSAKAIVEMGKILKILRLDKKIILSTAGLGDFIATVSSEYSQNRKVGKEIFEKGIPSQKSEGLVSLPSLLEKLDKKSKTLPLLSLLERIVLEQKDAKKEISTFLKKI